MADGKDQDGSNPCDAPESTGDVLKVEAAEADRVVLKTVKKRNAFVPLSPSTLGSLEDRKRNLESNRECKESEIKSSLQWQKRSVKCLPPIPVLAMRKMLSMKSCTKAGNSVLNDRTPSLNNFTLSDLRTATKNFSDKNIIGRGGYAEVYKGRTRDGMLIAVKRAIRGTRNDRIALFLSELGILAHIDHPNTAKLIGCCTQGGMHMVFHLSPLGSLRSHLHGLKGKPLNWSQRYKIATGTADGLTYLHENCQRRIIHIDIKADNILLSEDYNPQICDFGLAKWLPSELTHHNVSNYEGTAGYFAPEYIMHGVISEKTDVYAFGILLLELITGCRASDKSTEGLVVWAKPLLDNNDFQKLLDPALRDDYYLEELDRLALTASLCIEQSPILRPE